MATYLKRGEAAEAFDRAMVEDTVRTMLADIRTNREDAVLKYARDLDKWTNPEVRLSEDRIRQVEAMLPQTWKDDVAYAIQQVQDFARVQKAALQEVEVELQPGVVLGHRHIPVGSVGCYIPGGKYPLVAGAFMTAGTAQVAGVETILGCAPPRDADGMYPQTLYALKASGAGALYSLGGVQALASMAYGCFDMPACDMICGPGNPFVAEAKRQLFGTTGIDLLAGPTEILIIADGSVDAALVATDLLGQAEHGPDSPVWLIVTDEAFGHAVIAEVEKQLLTLPTREIAEKAWRNNGEVVVARDREEAADLSDAYAAEHLELLTGEDDWYFRRLKNYGSLFIGEESTVAYGDKGVGTNHTLPTGRAARFTGGLWVGKFLKTCTYQRLTPAASRHIAPVISRICEGEGMLAHGITADVRYTRFAPKNET
ncbi:MAG: histidinol dehydrogenase [Alphaproteobacteria bacterium]|nr:histidinol dehydrogenase [Alphaproteobacteria bacterium]MCB9929665.1 histidinol dehydrogenase [Alphaproteobacteria bacterium]